MFDIFCVLVYRNFSNIIQYRQYSQLTIQNKYYPTISKLSVSAILCKVGNNEHRIIFSFSSVVINVRIQFIISNIIISQEPMEDENLYCFVIAMRLNLNQMKDLPKKKELAIFCEK